LNLNTGQKSVTIRRIRVIRGPFPDIGSRRF
jgi:hypothetical protein